MKNTIDCIGMDWKNKSHTQTFCFPDDWEIYEYKMKDIPPLPAGTIRSKITGFFHFNGRMTDIRALAKGKHTAVILVDDLSRFTPSFEIAPIIIGELLEAGIKKDCIRIVIALGSHLGLTREEMILKLGQEIVENHQIINHDCRSEHVEDLGYNSFGTPIKINKDVVTADLVIGIGTMAKHRCAHGSGGAKIILPGVSHVETIRHNHKFESDEYELEKERHGKLRCGINEAGLMLSKRTDFILVNVALTRSRMISDIFIGNCFDVFDQNIDSVLQNYQIDLDMSVFGQDMKADIGVFCVDTLDPIQIGKAVKGWQNVCRIPVVTGDFSVHIYQGVVYGPYDKYLQKFHASPAPPVLSLAEVVKNKHIFIFSRQLNAKSAYLWNPTYHVLNSWDELIAGLYNILGGNRKIAFFHDAYLQVLKKI